MVNPIAPVVYGRYLIKSIKTPSGWKAQAWRKDRVAGPIIISSDRDEAILAVRTQLDQAIAIEKASRAPDGYPTTSEVRAALDAISMSDGQQKMLMAHLAAPDHILTATQLSQAASYKDYSAANLQYGLLGQILGEEMGWEPKEKLDGQPIWTFVLATAADKAESEKSMPYKEFQWRLRSQIVRALGF